MVDPTFPRTRVRVAWDCRFNPHESRHGNKWARIAGRPCVDSDPGPSHPIYVVDPTSPRTSVQVAWDN